MFTIGDRTVTDYAHLSGHQKVYDEITLGPSRIIGILEEGTFVIPNTETSCSHSGPWKVTLSRKSGLPEETSASEIPEVDEEYAV